MVCTVFEIVDDQVAMELEERFVVDLSIVEGQVNIGQVARVVVTIQDNGGENIYLHFECVCIICLCMYIMCL